MQKGFSTILVIAGLTALVGLAGGLFYAEKLATLKSQPRNLAPVERITPSQVASPSTSSSKQSASSVQQSRGIDEKSNWKTFQDNRYLFQFNYPINWSIDPPKQVNKTLVLKDQQKKDIISISSFNPTVVGISYCGANTSDKRCESVSIEDTSITIDWDVDGQAVAILRSSKVQFGLSITLLKMDQNSKDIFRQVLHTFKFNQ